MGVLVRSRNSPKSANKLLVKGAPSSVIERCTHAKLPNGKVVPMTSDLRASINEMSSNLARQPLRTLALAIKTNLPKSILSYSGGPNDVAGHPLLSDASKFEAIESGLTFVGLAGIKDPARPEVAGAIATCTKAGIRVMMITGDAKDTAIAIARDVNIFTKENVDNGTIKAFEGREFFELPEATQLEILKTDNIVFCRTEPADKQKLVKMLQQLGEIPAMTGDGVNDAPALQQSAIGIAMGITGTEVAKEAADMVLVDDNFATIVSAVEEGRCIYASMQAFICFLISCNIGEIFCIFLASLMGLPEPLTAMHLLWVNLVTDGPPATALGFNPPDPDVMDQAPREADEEIMTKWLLTRYMITGLYVGVATVGVSVWHYVSEMGITFKQLRSWTTCTECGEMFSKQGRMIPQTLALTTLVCLEMFKALSAVSVDNSLLVVPSWRNKFLLGGVAVPMLLHVFVVHSAKLGFGGFGEAFGMVPLNKKQWMKVLQFSAPILALDEVLKFVGRRVNKQKEVEKKQRKQNKLKGL
jgi:Ca2+-transporting ATPase